MKYLCTMNGTNQKGGLKMGLDMYLYKIQRLGKDRAESLRGRSVWDLPDWTHLIDVKSTSCYKEFEPYGHTISIKEGTNVDAEKLKERYNIPKEAVLSWSAEKLDKCTYTFTMAQWDKPRRITIPTNDAEAFMVPYYKDYLLCNFKEVGYWRKDYNLLDVIVDKLPELFNGGCHIIPDKVLEELYEEGYLKKQQITHGKLPIALLVSY